MKTKENLRERMVAMKEKKQLLDETALSYHCPAGVWASFSIARFICYP